MVVQPKDGTPLAKCEAVIQNLNFCSGIVADDWLVGQTKVFLRDTQVCCRVKQLRLHFLAPPNLSLFNYLLCVISQY